MSNSRLTCASSMNCPRRGGVLGAEVITAYAQPALLRPHPLSSALFPRLTCPRCIMAPHSYVFRPL